MGEIEDPGPVPMKMEGSALGSSRSQTRTEPSLWVVATVRPSGLKVSEKTAPRATAMTVGSAGLARLHSQTVPS